MQIDDSPWEIGKNYPVEAGLVGHPKAALAELAELLAARMTPELTAAARGAPPRASQSHHEQRAALRRQARSRSRRPADGAACA